MPRCCVPGCTNVSTEFRFPINPQKAQKWKFAIGKRDPRTGRFLKPSPDDIICRRHFTDDDFYERYSEDHPYILKNNAVPSVFLYTDEDLQELCLMEDSQESHGASEGPDVPSKQLRKLSFENANKFFSNWTPERSNRETRKLTRKIYNDGGRKSRFYDERGRFMRTGEDLCDCLDDACPGCHLPCSRCSSCKCGHECRANRRWVYDQLEVEGKEGFVKNKYKT